MIIVASNSAFCKPEENWLFKGTGSGVITQRVLQSTKNILFYVIVVKSQEEIEKNVGKRKDLLLCPPVCVEAIKV